MGKRPSPFVWACLSTLDTTLHWHAHTCIYIAAANTLTYLKKPHLLSSHRGKNRSADTRKLRVDVCLEQKSYQTQRKS